MDEDTHVSKRLPSYAVRLQLELSDLRHRISVLEKENSAQASKSQQEQHYRTLFGKDSSTLGVVQKVEKLWDFRGGVLKLLWSALTALVLGSGGLLV